MHIQCVICSDLITHNAIADIVGLTCGHIFHGPCLRTWIDRSATCPHCRARVTTTKQFKVFITIAPEPEGEDISTLTRNVDNLKYELKLKSMECSKLSEEATSYRNRAAGLVKEVRTLESKLVSVEDINLQLKEQRKYANNKARELSEAKFMIESLENELRQYQTLKAVVNSSNDEIDSDLDMLGPLQLSFLLKTFKKDINRLSKMDEDLKKALSKSESEKINLAKKSQDYQESLCLKDRVIETLKDSLTVFKEREKVLKKQLQEFTTKSDSSECKETLSGINRKGANSLLINGSDNVKENQKEEPTVTKKMKLSLEAEDITYNKFIIKKGDSVAGRKKVVIPPESLAAVRITSDRLHGIKVGNSLKQSMDLNGMNYDGLGGHSKPDIFPTGCKYRTSGIHKFSFKRK